MSEAKSSSDSRPWLPPVLRLLSLAPLAFLHLVADVLFLVLYYLLGFQRALVVDNIAKAFPATPPRAVRRLAARSYRNALHVLFETVSAQRLSQAQLAQRVTIENPQLVTGLLQRYTTIVAVAAHQGNWEWLQLACAAQLGAPLAALYKPVNIAGIDTLLHRMRSRFGSRLVAAQSALPGLLAFAREGGVIALVADQGPQPDEDKYWSRFLGRDTAFFTGPEKIARLLRAPLVFVAMQRSGRGRYRIRFETLAEPPYTQQEGELMQTYIRRVEQQVREAPEDWLWVYRRWKYRKSVYE